MKNSFIGKNGIPYSASDLEINNVLKNAELLESYSMEELHLLYSIYYGNYVPMYHYILSEKIKLYDTSINVNSFLVKGTPMWLDKATRVGLMHLANCSDQNIELVLGDSILSLSPEFIKGFLKDLELYASKCYVQTQKHLLAVKELKTAEDFINYDYTSGYPEKITLE